MKCLIRFYLLMCFAVPIIQNEPAIGHVRIEVCKVCITKVAASNIEWIGAR